MDLDKKDDMDDDDDVHHVELKTFFLSTWVTKWYGCIITIIFVIAIIVSLGIYLLLNPICLSFNFSDFKVIDSDISSNVYQLSLSGDTSFSNLYINIESESERRRRMLDITVYKYEDFYYRAQAAIYLNVFYYSKKSGNILTDSLIDLVHSIEIGIKNFSGYHDRSLIYKFSSSPTIYLESPPGSLITYLYPQIINDTYIFDGNGDSLCCNIITAIRTGIKEDIIPTDFFDFSFSVVNVSSKYLASVYPFGYNGNESRTDLENWIVGYTNYFNNLDSSLTKDIGIAYTDSRGYILNQELYYYLGQDLNLAIWSLIIIYIVVYLYSRSFWLTTMGLLGVVLSFIPCFGIYRLVWGESFNIVNLVAVWVILGIGCDDICVFISSYRRAPLESINGDIIPNNLRMAFAYREAGSAMFVTSFTTACSFFSLCFSTINPLPQFGFFLGSLVMFNFFMVMTWFPCILQMYVWFVMLTMKLKCFLPFCSKYLSVAVPLPEQHFQSKLNKRKSVKVLKRSSNKQHSIQLSDDFLNNSNNNDDKPIVVGQFSRQMSSKFVIPGNTSAIPGAAGSSDIIIMRPNSVEKRTSHKLVRQITQKIDDDGGFQADVKFGPCTNLYYLIMRKKWNGCIGLSLITIVFILTIIFIYTSTLIKLPTETARLLPDDTNWGAVQTALDNMDVDTDSFSGYSTSTGQSTGATVVAPAPPTPRPTKSPTNPTMSPVPTATPPTASPTNPTDSPTQIPTSSPTPRPTDNPITPDSPTVSPTSPTPNPTNNPSTLPTTSPLATPSPTNIPSLQPTLSPVTVQPTSLPSPQPSNAPTGPTNTPVTAQPTTKQPTNSPVPSPTANPTPQPTDNPVTPGTPTKSPTFPTPNPTDNPTNNPTTTQPTSLPSLLPTNLPSNIPTIVPTLQPIINPTLSPQTRSPTNDPTLSPTYPLPADVSFSCDNGVQNSVSALSEGDSFDCDVLLEDSNNDYTYLDISQIAIVFEGGGLTGGSNGLQGCNSYNSNSSYYNPSTYSSEYNTLWCYITLSDCTYCNINSETYRINFEYIAPYSASPEWLRVSLWLYYNQEWNIESNLDDTTWYNYSLVQNFSSLNEQTLSVDESITVFLLFGTKTVSDYTTDCEGDITSGSVTYDSSFNIYTDGSQYRWTDLCNDLNNINDNIMYRTDDDQEECFGKLFSNYVKYVGNEDWPIDNNNIQETFNTLLREYLTRTTAWDSINISLGLTFDNPSYFDNWIGFNLDEYTSSGISGWSDSSATVNWVYQKVQTQINNKWGGAKMYEYYEKWQDFMKEFNSKSPKEFKGIQTSSNYIRMEVELAFLDGFVKSVLYTLILCACVMIFFTANFALVILVCVYILVICIWVVGLFGAMGWPFGIIEIISVPTVIGLTIDYALHITHAYIHSPFPDRINRGKSAVNDLGSSVFASAMTTISSMLILYFATIVIFSDLGWVVGSTTAFGVALALLICPPLLMLCGPQRNVCHVTWCCRCNGIKIGNHLFCSNPWYGYQEQQQQKEKEKQQQQQQQQQNKDIELAIKDNNNNNNDIEDMYNQKEGTIGNEGDIVDNDNDVIKVSPPTTNGPPPGSIKSEQNVDLAPGSLNKYDNIKIIQNNDNVKYEKDIQANSDDDNDGNDDNMLLQNLDDDQAYVLKPSIADNDKQTDAGTPLVDDNGKQLGYNDVLNQQQMIFDNIDDQDQDDGSAPAPPAPAPPASAEEIYANQELMKQKMVTRGNTDVNDNDNDNMQLEQSISLEYDPN